VGFSYYFFMFSCYFISDWFLRRMNEAIFFGGLNFCWLLSFWPDFLGDPRSTTCKLSKRPF
jgi:hypothetical protein